MTPTLSAHASFGPSQLLAQHATPADLLVRFRLPGSGARRPVNLALAIDVSGSMAGSPLKHAIRAAQAVVDSLDAQDLLSVVLYDDSVTTLIAPTAVTDRAALKDRIGSIRAGGLTNLSGGWLKAIEHVQAGASGERVSRVLVLTDGQANVGITKDDVLIKTAGQKAEAGVSTTTLGFGSSFNEDLLMGMARAAGGNFYFIQSTDDARDVFSFELQTMKAVVAQNLTVILAPAPGVTVADILSLHRPGPHPLTLDLGDVYEDEDKLLGLRLNLPAQPAGLHELLTVTYSADTVHDGAIARLEGTLPVQATFGPLDANVTSDIEVTLDLARLQIARAKEEAVTLADQGQHAQGEALLRRVVAELTDAGLHEHFEIAEEIEQLEHYAGRIAAQTLVGDSRKELMDQAFQGRARTRADMTGRGVTVDTAVLALPVVAEPGSGVELQCVREGGKLRVRVVSAGYDQGLNVQFPRALRAEGAGYVVDGLEPSADGSFYRVTGEIRRLLRAGESDPLQHLSVGGRGAPRAASRPGVTKAARTAADLDTTDSSAGGILVQCVKEGSKLRARVVQDGFEPDWNMRFPRSIREEGTLYVVDEVNTAPDGKSYIASGEIRRLVQPV
ncbi:vWA domain-containing protein [Deinococcus aquaedulcis]|uniref:vWA domain-containing protein n=1 Tax=Deinococcus aquaedulcis TaxID=2840455 RepID=UPI001C83001C|nr:VWA domain-containing protein [Deinococcus aquaedulcis]